MTHIRTATTSVSETDVFGVVDPFRSVYDAQRLLSLSSLQVDSMAENFTAPRSFVGAFDTHADAQAHIEQFADGDMPSMAIGEWYPLSLISSAESGDEWLGVYVRMDIVED